jgi:coproporphyrinogen III oxidase-like Fe-S oxidoreductase
MQNVEREKEFFDLILDTLSADGYRPFELTKLIRNNLDRYEYMRVRHSGGSCIALGHGAGGNLDSYVYHNSVHSPLLDENVPISSMGRILDGPYFILDEFINDLQKMSVNLDVYSNRLDFALAPLLFESLDRLEKERLLTINGAEIKLSRDGIFWGNNIIDEFIRSVVGYVNEKGTK